MTDALALVAIHTFLAVDRMQGIQPSFFA